MLKAEALQLRLDWAGIPLGVQDSLRDFELLVPYWAQ